MNYIEIRANRYIDRISSLYLPMHTLAMTYHAYSSIHNWHYISLTMMSLN